LRAFQFQRDVIAGSIKHLSVAPIELPASIDRLQQDLKQSRKDIARLQQSLAVHEAARLLADAPHTDGVRVVIHALEAWDAAGLRAIATSLTANERVATALFSAAQPAAVAIARSGNVPLDATAILRTLMATFGGRGGGKGDLAQGAGLTGDLAAIIDAARAAITAALG
jgi:alanyl-tRNA synthetase